MSARSRTLQRSGFANRSGESSRTLAFAGHGGTNRVAFQGRISKHKRLAPGAYVMAISATNASGQPAHMMGLRFTIVG